MVIMTFMTSHDGVLEVTVAAAKARFSACLRAAEQGGTVVITKHGRRVAALVPAADAEELRRLRASGPARSRPSRPTPTRPSGTGSSRPGCGPPLRRHLETHRLLAILRAPLMAVQHGEAQ